MTKVYGNELEEVADWIVPWYLRKEMGIELLGPLEKGFLRAGIQEFEIDLFGQGCRGVDVYSIGVEAKSRGDLREIDAYVDRIRRIEAGRPDRYLWILFARRLERRARIRAQEAGIINIPWDYGFGSWKP